MPETKKADTLLTPDNHAVLLIDHQYVQLLATRSHPVDTVINNVTMLAKAAKIFKVPTLLSTVYGDRQEILPQIQAVFPDQKPIDRTGLNAWEEKGVHDWVQKAGKKKLVMAGLWTEVCLNLPAQSALAEGYEVYIVTDASGGSSSESHERGVQRLIQAGARPLTVAAYLSELQWDWAREETAGEVMKLFAELGGGFGQALRWEWQLLGLKEGGH